MIFISKMLHSKYIKVVYSTYAINHYGLVVICPCCVQGLLLVVLVIGLMLVLTSVDAAPTHHLPQVIFLHHS